MREKLLVHDKIFMKYIENSKDTMAMKSSLQDLLIAYQTAFNILVAGYAQVKVLAISGGNYYSKLEFIIAEITAESDKLLLATVYRPPKTGFLQEFENFLLELFTIQSRYLR